MTKSTTRIVKMLEKLDSVLQENNENAKAAVMVFKHFGEVSRKAKEGRRWSKWRKKKVICKSRLRRF